MARAVTLDSRVLVSDFNPGSATDEFYDLGSPVWLIWVSVDGSVTWERLSLLHGVDKDLKVSRLGVTPH